MTLNKKLSMYFGTIAACSGGLSAIFATSDYTPNVVQGVFILSTVASTGAAAYLWCKRNENPLAP